MPLPAPFVVGSGVGNQRGNVWGVRRHQVAQSWFRLQLQ